MKTLIIYYSRGGTTKKMAELIEQELKNQSIETDSVFADEVKIDSLTDYDGIIVGSPTYYGTMAAEIKSVLDKSVAFHGQLDGKVGAAFSSSANIAGGNETTIMAILEAMLIHGMIIQGDPKGDHYGPSAIKDVDSRAQDNCKRFAQRFAKLLKRVS